MPWWIYPGVETRYPLYRRLRQSEWVRKSLNHQRYQPGPLQDRNESLYQVRYHGPPINIDGHKSGTKQTDTHITGITDPDFLVPVSVDFCSLL
jgi:hypothetical protein